MPSTCCCRRSAVIDLKHGTISHIHTHTHIEILFSSTIFVCTLVQSSIYLLYSCIAFLQESLPRRKLVNYSFRTSLLLFHLFLLLLTHTQTLDDASSFSLRNHTARQFQSNQREVKQIYSLSKRRDKQMRLIFPVSLA